MLCRWILFCMLPVCAAAQQPDSMTATLRQHLLFLASDSLKGRGNYTPELQQAARYIAAEYKNAGLVPFPGFENYFQPFTTKEADSVFLLPDSSGNYNPRYVLQNVIALLPGKTKPGEVIIFSAHYDHLGVSKPGRDSIYNGANDNASGTAAMLALARYYAAQNNNERTLMFCAFAGEELGLFGSKHFSNIINAASVQAMINIEMIGRNGRAGKKAIFITGARHSNLQKILSKNLKGQGFRIKPEPDPYKNLFKRSDNFPFALKGVPAHTIMASDDDDACYHKACDEIDRIDMNNMQLILQALVRGMESIISGKDTPVRIRQDLLEDD